VTEVFTDTSAFLALLDAADTCHRRAATAVRRLRSRQASLVTTSYVLVETCALLDNRLGREGVRRFHDEFEPLLDVVWVTKAEHDAGMDLLSQRKRRVSLVDAVSFCVARQRGIEEAFAYDRDFKEEGFVLV